MLGQTQLAMKPGMAIIFITAALLPLVLASERCHEEPRCICKWLSGKRLVDCTGAGLNGIPDTLNPETQAIILDSNPLGIVPKNAFKVAGLLNLQKISMRSCHIREIHENAFRDLKNLKDLDLSLNNITKLQPKTFDGNNNLQNLKVAHNPIRSLMPYQFPPLRNLKMIDFSHCMLDTIDRKAFQNLGSGAGVDSIFLNNNNLRNIMMETFMPLHSLKTLTLHGNLWVCDCKLKHLRDFIVGKKLYNRPTACNEPTRLNGKMWDDVSPRDFACKPEIILLDEFVFGQPGDNATLSCHITGSPKPSAKWVVNGRIVNNNTSPVPFSDQRWIIHEQVLPDGIQLWFNLTITKAGYDNLGDYLCVAENNGGVMEKKVTLTFDDPSTLSNRGGLGLTGDQWTLVIAVVTASLLFIALMILICCCFCRSKKKSAEGGKNNQTPHTNGAISAYGDHDHADQSHQRLLANTNEAMVMSPCEKQVRYGDYRGLPQAETIMGGDHPHHHHHHHHGHYHYGPSELPEDLRAPSVVSSQKQGTDSSGHSRASFHSSDNAGDQYVPDLLDHRHHQHRNSPNPSGVLKTSTPLSASTLLSRHSPHQTILVTPGGGHRVSPSSNSTTHTSPFQRSGTLPLPQHHHPRSVSCDHTAGTQTLKLSHHNHHMQGQHLHHHLVHNNQHQGQRPGYVTLPRRPRASWSAPPRDSPSPSTGSAHGVYVTGMGTLRRDREPIYDGVGPRTSADGSSRISLTSNTLPRKLSQKVSIPSQQQASPAVSQPNTSGRYALPPYYAPIEELQECPSTPLANHTKKPHSTPNMLDLNGDSDPKDAVTPNESVATSSSEMTLMEENISGYCEPFGKAVVPDIKPATPRSRTSTTSAESELEAIIIPPPLPARNGEEDHLKPEENGNGPSSNRPHSTGSSTTSSTKENLNNGNGHHSPDSAGDTPVDPPPPMKPLLPTIVSNNNKANNNGLCETSLIGPFGDTPKKVPPKTLPKPPKVRPLPPPKPNKSAMSKPMVFQDEGVDGSEV